MYLLIIILLGKQIYKEMKQVDYYYNKFLLERYLNDYHFKKIKKIFDLKQMKKYYYHYFVINNVITDEKKMLSKIIKS